MKLHLSQIVNSKDALQNLLKEKFPIKLSYQLKGIVQKFDAEYSKYEVLKNELIIEKYGEEFEAGKWKVKPEYMAKFITELNELASIELDMPFEKVVLPESCAISVEDLILLDWVIKYDIQ